MKMTKEKHYPQVEMKLIYDRTGIYGKQGCKHKITYMEKEGHSICGIGDTVGQAIINLIESYKSVQGTVGFPFEKTFLDGKYIFTLTYALSHEDLQKMSEIETFEELDKRVKEHWECITNILTDSIVHDPSTFNDIYFECFSKKEEEEDA